MEKCINLQLLIGIWGMQLLKMYDSADKIHQKYFFL